MLNIFYGREDIDKIRFIFDNISEPTILTVPDQYSLQAEKDAFYYLKTQALMDTEVLSFSRLKDRVINETGGRRLPMIDKQGRHMLLTKVINDSADELEIYSRYKNSSGFLEMANNMISELKQCGISPAELDALKENISGRKLFERKLSETAVIYKGYEKAIEGHYIDTEDLASMFVNKIKDSTLVRDSEFWIYGFDVFSPKNLDAVEQLIKYSRGVNVVLSYDDKGRDRELFSAAGETIRRLEKAGQNVNCSAKLAPVPDSYRHKAKGRLAHLEKSLFALPAPIFEHGTEEDTDDKDDQIILVKASSVYAEAETAAAHMLELVRDRGFALRDIVVICNEKGKRAEAYRQAFSRYGIETFADEKRGIGHSPAAVYILALMQVIAGGYKGEDVIRMLKTGLTDLSRDETEDLENYVLSCSVKGSQWKKAFYKGKDDHSEEELLRLDELRIKAIGPVLSFHEKYKSEKKVAGKVMALYDFLTDMKIPEKLKALAQKQDEAGELEKAAETVQVWNKIAGILDQLVEILGDETIRAGDFFELLQSGINAVQIGLLPPALDGLMMGTMQRTRSGHVKAVIVLGANEGILPMDPQTSGLFSEDERQLVMELSSKHLLKTDSLRVAEERMAIYRNLSRPECELYISCSESGADGDKIRPSLIFDRIRKIFPDIIVRGDIFSSDDPVKLLGSAKSTLTHFTQALKEKDLSSDDDGIWMDLANWYEKNMPETFEMIKRGLSFDGRVEKIKEEFVRELYMGGREQLAVSPTRLEKYSGCPFAHFMRYGLRADEKKEYKIGNLEIGDVYHQCMDSFSRKMNAMTDGALTREDSPWMNISEEECKNMVGEIMDEIAAGYKEGILYQSGAEEYRLKRMKDVCSESAWMLTDQIRKGSISRMMCEAEFGRGKRLSPVEIETDCGKVFIEGKIDRMDILPGDRAKIIDYKSGSRKFDEKEARAGWSIQLMIYMRAAKENGYEPVGTFYYKMQDPIVEKKKESTDIEAEFRKQFKMEGILRGDAQTVSLIDNEMKRASQVIEGKKGFLTEEQFMELMQSVSEKVDQMCEEILEGRIEIRPKRTKSGYGDKTACDYCPYSNVCKFDLRIKGCRYEYV